MKIPLRTFSISHELTIELYWFAGESLSTSSDTLSSQTQETIEFRSFILMAGKTGHDFLMTIL